MNSHPNFPFLVGLAVALAFLVVLGSCSTGSLLRTDKAASGAKGIPYSLPRSVLKVTMVVARSAEPDPTFRVSLSGEVLTVPDQERTYVLQHQTSATREDDVKIRTNPDGLLESVVVHTDDKSVDVVKALAGGAAGVARIFAGAPGPSLLANSNIGKSSASEVLGPLVGKHEIFVPLERQANWSGEDGMFVVASDFAPFPSASEVHLRVLLRPAGMAPDDVAAQAQDGLRIDLPCTLPTNGLLIATRKPALIRAELKISSGAQTYGSADVQFLALIPDYAPVVALEFDRASFVKTTYATTFKDGVVTSFETNRPSSALALAAAPLDVAKEILRVPAEILQLKFNVTKAEGQLVDAESALAKSIAESTPDPVQEAQDSAIAKNNFEAAYYAALQDVVLAKAAFDNAPAEEKPQAKKAYIHAASAANNAAIAAGFAPPYNLAALP